MESSRVRREEKLAINRADVANTDDLADDRRPSHALPGAVASGAEPVTSWRHGCDSFVSQSGNRALNVTAAELKVRDKVAAIRERSADNRDAMAFAVGDDPIKGVFQLSLRPQIAVVAEELNRKNAGMRSAAQDGGCDFRAMAKTIVRVVLGSVTAEVQTRKHTLGRNLSGVDSAVDYGNDWA
jgi:hypothetical protein